MIPPDFSEVTSGSTILQSPSEYNKDVTDYLDEVVIKCIQSKRDKRYQTIEEFLFALQGEDDYKVLIDKAQKAEQNEEYEQAIHLLNESEKYIPLSSDLLELRYEYQNKLKQQQNERENKQKEEEALKLIHDGDFENALSILELLPFNAHIRQQMEKCRQGISLRKKTELIAEAENLIGKKQYENALSKYQEAKVIDQSDVAIDRSIEELQKILQDIEKNKKYNEFIAIGDKAFEDNEFEKALEAYKLAKDNVTLSSLTIDKKIETCVIALSERDEREKAKDAVANALAKVKDKPLLEIAEQELATEIEHNIGKLKLIEDFRVKYALSDAFHTEFLTSQARVKELEQLRLYFEAKTENDKRAYDVALKVLADVTSPTLKESVISLQKEIKNAQEIAKVEALEKEIKELIKKNDFHVAKNKLIEIEKVDKLLSASLQTTLDHKKLIYATSLNDEGDCKGAISLLQTIGAQSPSYNEAQKILDAINKKKVADNETTIIEQAKVAINKKNYQAATTLLNAIPNSSTSYGQVTQLFSTIDKELFDKAKTELDKHNWEKALVAFQAINSCSAYYKKAQRHIHILERQIEEQRYQTLLREAQQKVDEKKYNEARQILLTIPVGTTVYDTKEELLQQIIIEEKSKRKKLKVVLISLAALIIIILWGFAWVGSTEDETTGIVADELINDTVGYIEDSSKNVKEESIRDDKTLAEEEVNTERRNNVSENVKVEKETKVVNELKDKADEDKIKIEKAQERRASENKERIALTLVEEGNKLFSRGEYEVACEKYIQANRLSYGAGNVGASKFDELVQKLSFDKDAPAYKNNMTRANRIRNAK